MADIIGDVIRREGGLNNDPADGGGRTDKGISEKAHPEAWKDGKVTEEEARAIYEMKYVTVPGFHKVTDERLRAQLVDFGVNSGPTVAIMHLQRILGVADDGVLGPVTLGVLNERMPFEVNLLLMGSRIKMIGRIVQKNPSQLKLLSGWLSRSLEFH